MHTHAHTCTHTHVQAHAHTHTYVQTHAHTHMCRHMHTHTDTCTHTCADICTYADMHTLELEASHPEMTLTRGCGHTSPSYGHGRVVVHLCLGMSHTRTHTHTYIHTIPHARTHTHTYIHTIPHKQYINTRQYTHTLHIHRVTHREDNRKD